MPHRKSSGQVTFTLVQLLVVIGLMGLIVCYVVLVSNRVDRSSIRVKCAINLKQIGNALVLYAMENKGSFPRSHYVDGAAVQTTNDGFADINVGVALPTSPGKINNIPQAMFLLIRREDLTPVVFVCPNAMTAVADRMGGMPASSRSNFTGDGFRGGSVLPNVSYSFVNVYPTSTAEALGYKKFLTAYSSDFATAADLSPAAIDSAIWAKVVVGAPRSVMMTGNSPNHNGDGQNVLFADGHAEFQQTSLCGANNDNIYTPADTTPAGLTAGASATGKDPDPRSATDSVLMIHAK